MLMWTYTDRFGAGQIATSSPTTGVRTNADNQAPKFEEGASTFKVVMEDAAAETNVGSPIIATDVNGDALTYTLGGADAAHFTVTNPTDTSGTDVK